MARPHACIRRLGCTLGRRDYRLAAVTPARAAIGWRAVFACQGAIHNVIALSRKVEVRHAGFAHLDG